ncbi:MAG: radical SAM protein [Clostridiales bacterium]|nr:radical SAM protein [Clostridiales bacterium]
MIANDKPIIKLFTKSGHYYVYDTYFNTILEITNLHYKELSLVNDIGITAYLSLSKKEKEYNDICMLIHKGFMKPNIVDRVENSLSKYINQLLNSCVNDLVLQITKDCNFKCRYCGFANSTGIDRNHEKINMSWDIAKRSIDFLYRHSRDASLVNIAFYGGEPLLNFQLLKKITEYSNGLFKTKKIYYRMTTNASLLTDEIISFLVHNKFHISLSIDGPEEIQNVHRSFKINGNGTFSVVYNNFLKIKNNYPDYFDSYVKVMPVIVDGEDYNYILKYFKNLGFDQKQIKMLNAELSGIDFRADVYESHADDKAIKNVALLEAANKMDSVYQNKQNIPKIWHHNGTCIPGVKRLFVDTDGVFFPCEKILLRDNLSIGSLDCGFDITRIKNMANIGKMTENRCKKCWAMRFCEICVSQCNDIEQCEFTVNQKEHACQDQETKALWYLKNRAILIRQGE